MRFVAGKDDLLNGIRIVERATVVKGLQPVLANVLIETVGTSQIKLTATDFDLSITTLIDAQVEEEGKFTLPAKKLGEIISRLQDELVKIELNDSVATITCKNSKFDIIGISASEFPQVEENISEEDSIVIESKPFVKAIRQVISAAANYETNSLLSGVVCEDFIKLCSCLENVLCVNFDIACLTACAAERLMDHDFGIGKRKSFSGSAA